MTPPPLPTARTQRDGSQCWSLPKPPSLNEYWKPWRGRLIKTTKGKAYQTLIRQVGLAGRVRPLDGDVAVEILWFRRRKIGDLDNLCKCLLDGLAGTAYHNDRQVARLVMERYDDIGVGGECIVLVTRHHPMARPERGVA